MDIQLLWLISAIINIIVFCLSGFKEYNFLYIVFFSIIMYDLGVIKNHVKR